MCRRSARSLGQWDRSAYSPKVRGVVGSKDEGNAQRNAQTQKKQVYRISIKKALFRKLDDENIAYMCSGLVAKRSIRQLDRSTGEWASLFTTGKTL